MARALSLRILSHPAVLALGFELRLLYLTLYSRASSDGTVLGPEEDLRRALCPGTSPQLLAHLLGELAQAKLLQVSSAQQGQLLIVNDIADRSAARWARQQQRETGQAGHTDEAHSPVASSTASATTPPASQAPNAHAAPNGTATRVSAQQSPPSHAASAPARTTALMQGAPSAVATISPAASPHAASPSTASPHAPILIPSRHLARPLPQLSPGQRALRAGRIR